MKRQKKRGNKLYREKDSFDEKEKSGREEKKRRIETEGSDFREAVRPAEVSAS